MSIFYQDEWVTLHHGDYRDVLPTLEAVDHIICDPPYSPATHKSVRSRRMSANDRGGRYGADLRRQVDLGFDHITPDDMAFLAGEFARLAARWVLVFSDVESDHLWRAQMVDAGLGYVRTGAWVKRGSAPQFSGDRPATAFESITICHPSGRKRWNGGGRHALWDVPIVLNRARADKSERVHPTQKPEVLMRHLVCDFTDPGEVVLDATSGSGTTGVAAKVEGRRAVLIEQAEAHCETTAKRLELISPPLIFASRTPEQPALDWAGDAA